MGPTALKHRLNEDTRGLDTEGMKVLRARDFATLQPGERAVEYWELTEEARRSFREFLENPSVTAPGLRELLLELGRL